MRHRKLVAGVAGMSMAVAGTGAALAAKTPSKPPKAITVTQKDGTDFKPNRYIKDKMRWAKDTYTVKAGGTVTVKMTQPGEGPHSFSVVKKKDLPKTADEAFNNCKPCTTYFEEHGIDPNSNGPPQHMYVEDGNGQDTPPNLDKPGDSGITGPQKGDSFTFHVTAAKGTNLHFMCIFHPQMQAVLKVR